MRCSSAKRIHFDHEPAIRGVPLDPHEQSDQGRRRLTVGDAWTDNTSAPCR
jgi:hypothetical protein